MKSQFISLFYLPNKKNQAIYLMGITIKEGNPSETYSTGRKLLIIAKDKYNFFIGVDT